ncbi:MAG: peptide ABC transporter substrate-binding protein [Actinomycetota bacterium]
MGLALVGLVTTAVASAAGARTTSAQTAGVLRIAVTEPPNSFDPAILSDNRSIELAQNVFDGLVDVNNQMKVVPAIATGWKVTGGGKIYTFALRHNVRFQDGAPVVAQDFVDEFNRALAPSTASPDSFFLGDIAGADAVTKGKAKTASGLKAIGKYTLRVTLSHPAGYFPSLVSRWPAWVVDPKAVAKSPKNWAVAGSKAGTGPFVLSKEVGNTEYTFTANPSYFGGKPKLSKVEVTVLPSSAAAVARYQAGDFDAVVNLDSAAVQVVNSNSTLKSQFHSLPLLRTVWLGMANDKPPFNNLKVRQAFNHAIDRTSLIKIAAANQATAGSGWLPPGLPGSIAKTTKPYSYDPSLAKQLLSQAGYPNGQGFPSIDLYYTLGTGEYEQAFEFIQNQLQQNLGIKIGLKPMPANGFNSMMGDAAQRPLFWAYSFGLDYPDAQEQTTYLGITGAGYNFENFSNSQYDSLVNQANASPNQAKRASLYAASEKLRYNQAVDVVLYYPDTTWLVKPYVHGFGESPLYTKKWIGVSVGK